jgi:hypothetical protein
MSLIFQTACASRIGNPPRELAIKSTLAIVMGRPTMDRPIGTVMVDGKRTILATG